MLDLRNPPAYNANSTMKPLMICPFAFNLPSTPTCPRVAMKTPHSIYRLVCVLALLTISFSGAAGLLAEDKPSDAKDGEAFTVGEGAMTMKAPATWIKKKPATRIVEHEFEIPAAEGDARPSRTTIMGAGGSIEDNLNRWFGTFVQPDGSDTKAKSKVKVITVDGQEVHLVDISGTYNDKPAPFQPGAAVMRENYRQLAAIIVTKQAGNYFVKFYGPEKTIAANEQSFLKMIEGLKIK
jgi:hypothetical protein